MTRSIELPEPVYHALEQAARVSGATPADWIAARLQPRDDWLDRDFLKHYGHDADPALDLEAIRQAMAKIPGRLVDDIRAERDER